MIILRVGKFVQLWNSISI